MSMDNNDGMMILTGENRRTRRKTSHGETLSTTNPTRTEPGLRGERPETNRLSHGKAKQNGDNLNNTRRETSSNEH
jgi:hypothetical protein